jgi:L-lactate dehydrogenase complex protein LldF
VTFQTRAAAALDDAPLRASVQSVTDLLVGNRVDALERLANPDELRDAARALRTDTVGRLPELLGQWSDRFEANGGRVHWATDGTEAVAHIIDILGRAGATAVVKGKSMASEEIHLNPALEADGRRVVETDLGEFIVQLAHEAPSHIILPAIHKDRHDVAELFTADAGEPVPPVVDDEAAYARRRLRELFLSADAGITGVNFAVAETGSVCLVENEGNGRMCTTLPRVHIAIMGMERVVADLAELDVCLALLARSATGQDLTVYTNLLSGPRRPGEVDGPDEMHVIVLDNGRHDVLAGEFREALNCIRCGACLNVCPVYRQVGGHAYGSVYPGPIGAVLTPLLHPDDPAARELSQASSLCGACWEACPVRIPLHDMLLGLRRRDAPADAPISQRVGFGLWSALWSTRAGMAATRAVTPLALRLTRRVPPSRLPGWAGAWARTRDLP